MTPGEPPQSRADVQAQLRAQKKREARHRHRWRRRILYSLASLILLITVAGVSLYLYANYRFDQIAKVHSKHLIGQSTGKPFTLLLVGSDSRAFVDNSTQVRAFGNQADAGGQRSDVTMVARFVPATKTVTVLSLPRDLWVDIPHNSGNIVGYNRINAAYNVGPDLLVQTIEKVLHVPINHYMAVGFPGFSGMVNALGGITMDFPTEVRDTYSGLNVTTLGCQVVNGTTALQLVRSRHMEYVNPNGDWEYDGLSDFSRILRQDTFFRAVLAKVNASITNPLAINGFISAAVGNLTIDDTLSQGDILHIAREFRGLPSSHLITETLPTVSHTTGGGAAVLLAAQPYAANMIKAFNQTGQPTVARSLIDVEVLNASTVNGIAHTTAIALTAAGYHVASVVNATTPLVGGSPSQIWYGPTGLAAAHTLGASLTGNLTYVPDSSLSGNTVELLIAGSQLTVAGTATTSTTTTIPTTGATTTTTIPSNVYANKQVEPWNPVPCTLGASTQTNKK